MHLPPPIVQRVEHSFAYVRSWNDARVGALVWCNHLPAVVTELTRDSVTLAVLSHGITKGMTVQTSHQLHAVPCGPQVLGRVLDVAGQALDEGPSLSLDTSAPLGTKPLPLHERRAISSMLPTGIRWIDFLQPLHEGTAQFLVGVPRSGKSSIVRTITAAHALHNGVCVVAAVGWELSQVYDFVAFLRRKRALDRTVLLVAQAGAPPFAKTLLCTAAAVLAAHFARAQIRTLLVLDALNAHDDAFRALCVERHTHHAIDAQLYAKQAALFDRAAMLSKGSLTILATIAQEPSALNASPYAQLLEQTPWELTRAQRFPAFSTRGWTGVTKLGFLIHPPGLRRWAAKARLELVQAREIRAVLQADPSMTLEALDRSTRAILLRADRIDTALEQSTEQVCTVAETMARMLPVVAGTTDAVPLDALTQWLEAFERHTVEHSPHAPSSLVKTHDEALARRLCENFSFASRTQRPTT